ncbi:MAG: right-handed parallel beta-helix repeat-containing protein [Phycisphaeraceae bacterium]|nr:right-handed parallel beta-helix repeat-containing protein [Phycisphaeraceae bacterium]
MTSVRASLPWILAAAAMLAAASAADATTYFVRKTGSDSNSGTSKNAAWRTVDKAATVASAGDIVYVGAGTYSEQVSPDKDGTVGSRIRYIADVNGTYTGDSGAVIVQAPNGKNALSLDNADYTEFTGFQFVGSTGKDAVIWKKAVGGLLDSCIIRDSPKDGIDIDDATLTITNCTIYNTKNHGVIASGSTSVITITDSVIRDCGNNAIDLNTSCTVSVAGCSLYNNKDAINISGAVSATVRSTQIFTSINGIWLAGNCTFSAANCLIHTMSGDAVRLENKSGINASFWHLTAYGISGNAFYMRNGAATIKNCIVSTCSGRGLYVTGGSLIHSHNILHNIAAGAYSGTSSAVGETTADPKFVWTGIDFHLSASSPAINTGTSASPVTTADLGGSVRPQGGGWDIGCYEFGAGGTPTPKLVSWTEIEP